jgi:hypothetical protein
MGFPNVDKILVRMFGQEFEALKLDSDYIINDLFEDLDPDEREEITTYIQRKEFVTDIRRREDSAVYLLTTFSTLDLPFPQISVTLGQEDTDRYMGDQVGQSAPVLDGNGATIAWDITKGFYAKSNWNISVVTATKDEAIWLSRLCQLFIFKNMMELEEAGVAEVNLSISDMKLEQDQQPLTVISRGIRMSATTLNSWIKRVPVSFYQTGNNLALN